MSEERPVPRSLAALTPARVALGRAGAALPTAELLRFGLAHARARDAVHAPLRPAVLAAALAELGLETIDVASAAGSREEYLLRPDRGRSLRQEGHLALSARARRCDLAIIVADGLSATAVHGNAAPLIGAMLPLIAGQGLKLAPVVIAVQARVALGDAIGAALGARLALVLIGERPGLSAPDSLGAYLTYAPRLGLTDEARNCVSNIRPGGLSHERAAFILSWLIAEALRRGLTGVALKDESAAALPGRPGVPLLP